MADKPELVEPSPSEQLELQQTEVGLLFMKSVIAFFTDKAEIRVGNLPVRFKMDP